MSEIFDLGIIGAGPAGYTAALHAAACGLSVVMFEKDMIGGVCLNRGCIPTKTILHAAELYKQLKSSQELGIYAEKLEYDFSKIIEHKNNTVARLRKGLELALKNAKVQIVNAKAELLDKNTIKADDKIYNCKKTIVAAGSEPKSLTGLEYDHKFILNSDDILNLKELPESILIIGSGAIGVEWARIFAAFGVEVTVLEAADRLLPLADAEISRRIERIFKSEKIKFYTSTTVEKTGGEKIYLSNEKEFTAKKILVAVGRTPCIKQKMEGVSYIGDVCGEIQLAHFAIKQAIAEVRGIPFNKSYVPSVVYGCPEIAWVGKREQDLQEGTYQKVTLPVSALGKSHCDNCIDGIIKILVQDDKIVGAHIVSKEASALIQQILIAMQNEIPVDKLKELCFAHPTYSEGIFECLFRI